MHTECPYRIVLADDHPMFLHDLKRILGERSDLEITGEAGDGAELLQILCMTAPVPNLAIIDITMPHMDGIKATVAIKRTYPDIKVLILSMHQEQLYVQRALLAGADGYLLKENAIPDLFPAIEKIRRGGIYLSPELEEEVAP